MQNGHVGLFAIGIQKFGYWRLNSLVLISTSRDFQKVIFDLLLLEQYQQQ